ncbi:hypothetical protein LTR84_011986 [Exophiala bonariae]|uniref:Uncharacterized protein n=1 Tax=Exophiala bonariae TaxID=1690606 RepID=A0AAV9MU30_9EURO|nr:hypothetical protein LTR84_011986 [Exophiala bonariae]
MAKSTDAEFNKQDTNTDDIRQSRDTDKSYASRSDQLSIPVTKNETSVQRPNDARKALSSFRLAAVLSNIARKDHPVHPQSRTTGRHFSTGAPVSAGICREFKMTQ